MYAKWTGGIPGDLAEISNLYNSESYLNEVDAKLSSLIDRYDACEYGSRKSLGESSGVGGWWGGAN